jgi:hypothetical protein
MVMLRKKISFSKVNALLVTVFTGALIVVPIVIYELGTSNVSYNIETVKVVDGGNARGLKILDEDSNKIADDVYAATVRIWNSGSVGITKEKIEPGVVTISTPDNKRIVHHDVITSIPDLGRDDRCIPDPSQADTWFTIACPSQSKLEIKFKSFSTSAEIKLSVVYTGDQVLHVSETGIFSDVPKLKKVRTELERKSYITLLRDIAISAGLFSFFVLLILVLLVPAQSAPPATDPNDRLSPNEPRAILNSPMVIGNWLAAPVIIGLFVFMLAIIGWVVAILTNLPPA